MEQLLGLWGGEIVFGPLIRGQLTIDGRGQEWIASVKGFDAIVEQKDNSTSFTLPGGHGEFRGHVGRTANSIEGHWIQPAGVTLSDRYASPLTLTRLEENVWRGKVVPLDDTLTIYLAIRKNADGSLGGFIRNPEFNLGVGRPFAISVDADLITFSNKRNPNDRLHGNYDRKNDRLHFALPDWGASLELTRRDRNNAYGFYPRTPNNAGYAYRQPISEDDGWTTGSLTSVGLDSKPITSLVEHICNTEPTDYTTPYVQGLLIARHGKLVLEEYFNGFDKDRPHDTRSAGKTFASVLVGIAIDSGAKFGVNSPVYPLFPEYKFPNMDPRKMHLTVENLLTMTTGLACDDNDDDSPGNEGVMQGQRLQPDWYEYTLGLPVSHEPGGSQAVYCSATINLLGGVVKNTMRTWIPEFFHKHYAKPMQIRRYHMNLMPTGEGYVGGGVYMRPRDLLKLGQLYLSGGTWNGTRVLSRSWVDQSTKRHSSYDREHGYGYAWHIHEYHAQGIVYKGHSAEGNGGQLVIVIPQLDLVVLFTAGNYQSYPVWRRFGEELVPQYVLRAASPSKN